MGDESVEYILPPWEAEALIENLRPSSLDEIGMKKWFENHQRLMLLHQQSVLEISTLREEAVKEWFVNFQKIPILIYEAIQISIWKEKVFPVIIGANGEPSNTFMMYSIFYHESLVVSLLENVLFHSDSVETLDDSALDLVDYSIGNVTALIFSETEPQVSLPENASCLEELVFKRQQMQFDIAMKSISILSYLSGFAESLSLAVIKRLMATHDLPYLMTTLIEKKPWRKISKEGEEIYTSTWEKVKENERDKICKTEGQIWIALRELLLNPKCAPYYPINEFRISELSKLQKYLHERVLDQISPLIDLRRWLGYLTLSPPANNSNPPISVEIIPQIRSSILDKYRKKWKKIAKFQGELFYNNDVNHVKSYAEILSAAYDVDKIVATATKTCALCLQIATKKCSKCKIVWYCGRECQVKDWTTHKDQCEMIKSAET
ncbi:zinc finger MYND domain-containing protein 10 [Fopius arisanus]|uniref:Zinc finger MYND domain-containing protein 10 n=2 Tax=Fopius arisanus TaxID=64838 RepID=A0A9R1ST86_9HYME|nr:PREDICTED: zinc finger MYND domain-containing protein 10 [Fopius arisanus]